MKRLVALITALVLLVSACGGQSNDSGSTADGRPATTVAARSESGADSAAVDVNESESGAPGGGEIDADVTSGSSPDSGGSGEPPVIAASPPDAGRDIIFTGFVAIEVDDVKEAQDEITRRVASWQGIIFGQQSTHEGQVRSTMVIKLPPSQFQSAISSFDDLGILRQQQVEAEDVTERVVDLDSRISAAEISVERLRGWLNEADSIAEIVELESELMRRESELEVLRGQRRTLGEQVAWATITVELNEAIPGPAIELMSSFYVGSGEDRCPGVEEFEATEGETFTACYTVTNVGDTVLDRIEITDSRLGLRSRDIIGSGPDAPSNITLQPGEQVTFTAEVEAKTSMRSNASVSARALTVDGVAGESVSAHGEGEVLILADDSLPGFSDGFGSGWGLLGRIVDALVLAVGFALPLIWIPVLAFFGIRFWIRRRRAGRPTPPPPAGYHPAAPAAAPAVATPSPDPVD